MTRRLLAVLAVGVLAAAPSALHAQSISLAGGLALPTGNLSNSEQSGYNAALGLNFGALLLPVGARLEGAYNGFNHKNSISGDTRIMSATANATFGLGGPYVIGGLGYYNARVKLPLPIGETSYDGAGFNIGVGMHFPVPTLSPFLEVRYHQMLGDTNKYIKFVPITFGIQF
jgi:hypothetical protein